MYNIKEVPAHLELELDEDITLRSLPKIGWYFNKNKISWSNKGIRVDDEYGRMTVLWLYDIDEDTLYNDHLKNICSLM